MTCPRCLFGVDDDGDGDCSNCAQMSDLQLNNFLRLMLKLEMETNTQRHRELHAAWEIIRGMAKERDKILKSCSTLGTP